MAEKGKTGEKRYADSERLLKEARGRLGVESMAAVQVVGYGTSLPRTQNPSRLERVAAFLCVPVPSPRLGRGLSARLLDPWEGDHACNGERHAESTNMPTLHGGKKMSFSEKIDTLDLIINCLTEHEQSLDASAARLEELSKMIPVSGRLKKTGNSISLTVPKDIADHHGLEAGTHIQAYMRKVQYPVGEKKGTKNEE